MGEVYRASDTKLHRDVAIKVLPEVFASDPERMLRFSREAQVLASLNHPNIAAIHGLEEADGRRALVMELVEGETLAERLARGPVPLEEALGHRAADRRSPRGGPRARDHPPRSEAGERQGDARGEREAPRLRSRQGARGRAGLVGRDRPQPVADARRHGNPGGHDPRHGRLHEPGAGARAEGRPPLGRLVLRRRALRAADGQAGLRGRHRLGRPRLGPEGRPGVERAAGRAAGRGRAARAALPGARPEAAPAVDRRRPHRRRREPGAAGRPRRDGAARGPERRRRADAACCRGCSSAWPPPGSWPRWACERSGPPRTNRRCASASRSASAPST